MIMYTFLYFSSSSSSRRVYNFFLRKKQQHNTFTAVVKRRIGKSNSYFVLYFNFLLLFIHFPFYEISISRRRVFFHPSHRRAALGFQVEGK